MNIVVCVKQVPDTWSEKKLAAGDARWIVRLPIR